MTSRRLGIVLFLLIILFGVRAYQAVADAPAAPFLPRGEWETPGGVLSLNFNLEQGKIHSVEEGVASESAYRIIRQSPYMLSVVPYAHAPERDAPEGDGAIPLTSRNSKDLTRLNDNALVYAGGCVGGFLLLRKDAGLSLSDKSHATGRWGFPDGEGGWEIVVDFDKKRETGYTSGPFEFTERNPGEVLITLDGKEMIARWFGSDIMGIYMPELRGNLPPFGFVRIE